MKTLLANVVTLWIHGIAIRFCRLITLQLCRQVMAVVLVAGAVLAGCSPVPGHGTFYYGYEMTALPPSVNFASERVLSSCNYLTSVSAEVYETLPSDKRMFLRSQGAYPDREGDCVGLKKYLEFSLVQLNEDALSITAESGEAEWIDKYTLLVVAEKGKSLGFKYAVFAATENRDESVTTPLETKTTTSGSDSDIDLTSYLPGYYPSLGIGTSTSSSSTTTKTTTTGGETTTTYKRAHTVKFSNEKLPNSFNLELVAKSIKGNYGWEIKL